MTAMDKLEARGPKKLLALDGGGIRGALTVEVLAGLESMLRSEVRHDLVLGDYFDYIGGTSTGAILAAALAQGMSTDELGVFYEESGPVMFEKAFILERFRYKYAQDALAKKLQEVFGQETLLGSPSLRTLLLMVLRNATTDSPWPLSNNPKAKYNNTHNDKDNLRLPLWQLVRASTAAPTYFPPEEIMVGEHRFLFVDGGVTMYNNPSFQMFLMATIPAYKVEWPTGVQQMLIVSAGTGHAPDANKNLDADDMNLLYHAGSVPSALMTAALHEQDILCRVFGNCLVGDEIDRELRDLKKTPAPGKRENLFTYLRYNAELTEEGLAKLGLGHIEPQRVRKLDSTAAIGELQTIGSKVAEEIDPKHYAGFLED